MGSKCCAADVSKKKKKTGNWRKGHPCFTLVKYLGVAYLCSDILWGVKCKLFGKWNFKAK